MASARVRLLHFERDHNAMNAVYAGYFPKGHRPARTCVGICGPAKGVLIEIDLAVGGHMPTDANS